jgi:hypothetical protein
MSKWNGSTWVLLSSSLQTRQVSVSQTSFTVGEDGNPAVAWLEPISNQMMAAYGADISQWDGKSWRAIAQDEFANQSLQG